MKDYFVPGIKGPDGIKNPNGIKGPNGITEKESNNLQNNIFLIMQMFPNQDIVSCCKKLNVDPKKLGVEYDLIAKIRDWKINNLDLIDSE